MPTYTERILGLLGDRPPVASLQQTAAPIQEIARRRDAEGLARPFAPGKWTAAQVLCRLADAEIATGFRLRQVLSQDNHVIQPFDQDRWADRYPGLDGTAAARTFGALREWNLALIRSLSPADLARPAHHRERGPDPRGRSSRCWPATTSTTWPSWSSASVVADEIEVGAPRKIRTCDLQNS